MDESFLNSLARKGDLTRLHAILQENWDIASLSSAFLVAASFGHIEASKMLLERGADINFKDSHGKTALSLIARNEYHYMEKTHQDGMLHLLLSRRASTESRDETGMTPLMHACQGDNSNIITHLIHSQADVLSVNDHENCNLTPLMYACSRGHLRTAELLLKHNASLHIDHKSGEDFSALAIAIRKRNSPLASLLITHKADISATFTKLRRTPLHYAVLMGDPAMVDTLTSLYAAQHADVHHGATQLTEKSPDQLDSEIRDPEIPMIDVLDATNKSALMMACETGNLSIVKCLLAAKCNVNAPFSGIDIQYNKYNEFACDVSLHSLQSPHCPQPHAGSTNIDTDSTKTQITTMTTMNPSSTGYPSLTGYPASTTAATAPSVPITSCTQSADASCVQQCSSRPDTRSDTLADAAAHMHDMRYIGQWTALTYACVGGHTEIVRVLLNAHSTSHVGGGNAALRPANIHYKYNKENVSYYSQHWREPLRKIQELERIFPVNVFQMYETLESEEIRDRKDVKDVVQQVVPTEGYTLLMFAVQYQHISTVKVLLQHKTCSYRDLIAYNLDNKCVFYLAGEAQHHKNREIFTYLTEYYWSLWKKHMKAYKHNEKEWNKMLVDSSTPEKPEDARFSEGDANSQVKTLHNNPICLCDTVLWRFIQQDESKQQWKQYLYPHTSSNHPPPPEKHKKSGFLKRIQRFFCGVVPESEDREGLLLPRAVTEDVAAVGVTGDVHTRVAENTYSPPHFGKNEIPEKDSQVPDWLVYHAPFKYIDNDEEAEHLIRNIDYFSTEDDSAPLNDDTMPNLDTGATAAIDVNDENRRLIANTFTDHNPIFDHFHVDAHHDTDPNHSLNSNNTTNTTSPPAAAPARRPLIPTLPSPATPHVLQLQLPLTRGPVSTPPAPLAPEHPREYLPLSRAPSRALVNRPASAQDAAGRPPLAPLAPGVMLEASTIQAGTASPATRAAAPASTSTRPATTSTPGSAELPPLTPIASSILASLALSVPPIVPTIEPGSGYTADGLSADGLSARADSTGAANTSLESAGVESRLASAGSGGDRSTTQARNEPLGLSLDLISIFPNPVPVPSPHYTLSPTGISDISDNTGISGISGVSPDAAASSLHVDSAPLPWDADVIDDAYLASLLNIGDGAGPAEIDALIGGDIGVAGTSAAADGVDVSVGVAAPQRTANVARHRANTRHVDDHLTDNDTLFSPAARSPRDAVRVANALTPPAANVRTPAIAHHVAPLEDIEDEPAAARMEFVINTNSFYDGLCGYKHVMGLDACDKGRNTLANWSSGYRSGDSSPATLLSATRSSTSVDSRDLFAYKSVLSVNISRKRVQKVLLFQRITNDTNAGMDSNECNRSQHILTTSSSSSSSSAASPAEYRSLSPSFNTSSTTMRGYLAQHRPSAHLYRRDLTATALELKYGAMWSLLIDFWKKYNHNVSRVREYVKFLRVSVNMKTKLETVNASLLSNDVYPSSLTLVSQDDAYYNMDVELTSDGRPFAMFAIDLRKDYFDDIVNFSEKEQIPPGFDPNLRDTNLKRTMLMSAIMQNHEDIVQFLVRKGANVTACDRVGQTAAMYAVNSRHDEQTVKKYLTLLLSSSTGTHTSNPEQRRH